MTRESGPKSQGRLFVFEGPDGVGKSALAVGLADYLLRCGVSHEMVSFPGRITGSLGRHVRDIHHSPRKFGIKRIEAASLQVLHIAAHIDAIEHRIRPILDRGRWVILDRYWWSTVVYGGIVGVPRASLEAMVALERVHWGPIRPSAIILVLRSSPIGRSARLEDHRKLLAAYQDLALEQTAVQRVHIVWNEKTLGSARKEMLEAIADLLPSHEGSSISAGRIQRSSTSKDADRKWS